VARGGYGLEAEAHMVERIDALPAWTAINMMSRTRPVFIVVTPALTSAGDVRGHPVIVSPRPLF